MELLTTLDGQRRHVLGIVEGLADEDLRRPLLPSGWTCLGLINHLALDVERFWFLAVIAGQRQAIDERATAADAWQVDPAMRSGAGAQWARNLLLGLAEADPDATDELIAVVRSTTQRSTTR